MNENVWNLIKISSKCICAGQIDGKSRFVEMPSVASLTEEVYPWLAKRPLKTNGRLANPKLTSLVKEGKVTSHDLNQGMW